MEDKEFELKDFSNLKFRFTYVSPIDAVTFASIFNAENFKTNRELLVYALEHAEVRLNEQWIKVKQPNKEVYMPSGIDEKPSCILEILNLFVDRYILPVFQKSSE
jgi:hypothetical protein